MKRETVEIQFVKLRGCTDKDAGAGRMSGKVKDTKGSTGGSGREPGGAWNICFGQVFHCLW